ncbi:hypothetical protein F3Y22_tig00111166pilonHSYRG00166 [Hibiscus syriacus]|uniref:Uncharacterized protein n=1 Tax=Hibiscus syriacus TaxID=106335 RepID=A0A6A2YY53_HIBSY|nr:hypothetical protein F3Y22_tig00111166pilonHSYRG00166 [Hibiscus syriacus]
MEFTTNLKAFTHKKLNVVLDEMNFLIWTQQILLTIRSYRLERLLTGATVTPPETVVDDDVTVRVNDEYEDFVAQDSALASWLLSTISPHLLPQFVGTKTTTTVWNTMLHLFTPAAHGSDIAAFADANWGANIDDRRSIIEYGVFLGKCLVTWCSKKQRKVSRSTMEAEYKSVADTAAYITWIQVLLTDLGIQHDHKPVVWYDNTSAVAMSANPVYHAQSKHVDLDVHFVREKLLINCVSVTCEEAWRILAEQYHIVSIRNIALKLEPRVRRPELFVKMAVVFMTERNQRMSGEVTVYWTETGHCQRKRIQVGVGSQGFIELNINCFDGFRVGFLARKIDDVRDCMAKYG